MRKKSLSSLQAVHNHALPVAIDFGASALRLLQIAAGEPPRLVAASQIEVPDELVADPAARLRFQIDSLPKLVKKSKFTTKRAVFMIPSGQIFCKHMQFQLSEGVDVESLLRATLPTQVGCDYESLVCRHVTVNEGNRGGKSEVICMAASRELVGRLMQAIKVSHLEPVGVHSPFQAAIRAFWGINRRAEDLSRTTLYVDLGYGGTNVLIAEGESLVFARTVDLSGLHMDQAIAQQARVSLHDARALRRRIVMEQPSTAPKTVATGGEGLAMLTAALAAAKHDSSDATEAQEQAEAVAVAEERRTGQKNAPGLSGEVAPAPSRTVFPPGVNLKEQLEILTDEIQMCVRYHKSMFPNRPIERAVFFGGDARQPWLCQHLARGLRMAVQVSDPIGGLTRSGSETTIGVNLGEPQPGWTAALGMCLSPTDL